MTTPSREAAQLLDRLERLEQLLAQQKATTALLERERLQLQTALKQTGYRPPPARQGDT